MSPIIEAIQQQGGRITETRRLLAEHLDQCRGLFCVKDLVQKFPALDTVSIYRTIELFESLHVISPALQLDGHQFYEVHAHDDSHHHHVICTSCQKSACVDCRVSVCNDVPGFSSVHHTVVMKGVCTQCEKT